MKKLGLYVALTLFVPSVMATDLVASNIAVAVAEAGANYSWTLESLEKKMNATHSRKVTEYNSRLADQISAKLEKKIELNRQQQFAAQL